MLRLWLPVLTYISPLVSASWYDEAEVDWNLNVNQHATNVLEYTSPDWPDNFTHTPSPRNWRFPFYSFFADRFVNGDPTNDNANGTTWEHDLTGTRLRHGGDIKGVQASLDYLHGMGIRGLYIAGNPMLNNPWEADSYSPIDHSILDHHFGTIKQYREVIQAIHDKGMYVLFDNTMATMGDLFMLMDTAIQAHRGLSMSII